MELTDKEIDDALNELAKWDVISALEDKIDDFNNSLSLTKQELIEYGKIQQQLANLVIKKNAHKDS